MPLDCRLPHIRLPAQVGPDVAPLGASGPLARRSPNSGKGFRRACFSTLVPRAWGDGPAPCPPPSAVGRSPRADLGTTGTLKGAPGSGRSAHPPRGRGCGGRRAGRLQKRDSGDSAWNTRKAPPGGTPLGRSVLTLPTCCCPEGRVRPPRRLPRPGELRALPGPARGCTQGLTVPGDSCVYLPRGSREERGVAQAGSGERWGPNVGSR